jgi:DNA-binding NtrC family response regulator
LTFAGKFAVRANPQASETEAAGNLTIPDGGICDMGHEIYLVETPRAPSSAILDRVLERANLRISERVAWPEARPSEMRPDRLAAIVANAVPGTQEAREFFALLQAHPVSAPVFAILPADDRGLMEAAMRAVDDFLLWPVRGDEMFFRLQRLAGPAPVARQTLHHSLAAEAGLRQLIGEEPAFVDALLQLARFGRSDAAVLLTGETGTGKELCARAVHLLSRRRGGPFVPVECGSIPEHIFESEFFGHLRGAFTDARSEQKGLVAVAHGGTIFLDEVDSLSPAMQGKLLRLLQEQTYRPLGSEQYCRADVRVVAASNCDLAALVRRQRFRSDLYFRLDVLRVHLPPLRERKRDVALLARQFIAEICAKDGLGRKTLTPSAVRRLQTYAWPGNIRELHNAVRRAALSADGTEIYPRHLTLGNERPAPESIIAEGAPDIASESFRAGKRRAIETFERAYVQELLHTFRGNMTRAAREAGKDRRAFGRLAKKYGLTQSQV